MRNQSKGMRAVLKSAGLASARIGAAWGKAFSGAKNLERAFKE